MPKILRQGFWKAPISRLAVWRQFRRVPIDECNQTYSTLRGLRPFLITSKWPLSSVYRSAPMDIAPKGSFGSSGYPMNAGICRAGKTGTDRTCSRLTGCLRSRLSTLPHPLHRMRFFARDHPRLCVFLHSPVKSLTSRVDVRSNVFHGLRVQS